jgi:hypothetical protein
MSSLPQTDGLTVALSQSTLALVGLRQIKISQGMPPKVSLDRDQVFHASSARAGRSRERQAKWAGPRVGASRAALATAPFLVSAACSHAAE